MSFIPFCRTNIKRNHTWTVWYNQANRRITWLCNSRWRSTLTKILTEVTEEESSRDGGSKNSQVHQLIRRHRSAGTERHISSKQCSYTNMIHQIFTEQSMTDAIKATHTGNPTQSIAIPCIKDYLGRANHFYFYWDCITEYIL